MPTLTEERRKQLVKTVGKFAEDARVAIRNVRREANDKLKGLAKDKKVSQDEERRGHDTIQKSTDRFIGKVDELIEEEGRRGPRDLGAPPPPGEEETPHFPGRLLLPPVHLTPMAFPPASGVSVAELSRLPEAELRSRVLARPRPRHVAIIMDGNGRWATKRGLPRVAGHHQGVKAVRETVRQAGELGVDFLTLYAFSSENWQRPETEVSFLMTLLERTIDGELPDLMARTSVSA